MTKTHFSLIFIATFLISVSYFIGSIFFKDQAFYFFDLLWRISLIFTVIVVAKYRPHITFKQWILLLLFFTIEFVAYTFLSPQYSTTRILISVAFAPIAEEFFFRGWMMQKIQGTDAKKIIISSFLFGLYHLKNFGVLTTPALATQIIYASFFIGPLLAWARLRGGSLFGSLLLHSGNNAFADIVTSHTLPLVTLRNKNFK